jgi:hypothetical protein
MLSGESEAKKQGIAPDTAGDFLAEVSVKISLGF